MNERIRELAKEAGFQINPLKGLIHLPGLNPTANIQLEKFAELIVNECAHLVGGYTKENEFGTDVKEAYEEITKHFGVEE
jgi:hypothetical protein